MIDKPMKHVMVDIETMGTSPRAPILAIGAIMFDPYTGDLGARLLIRPISLESNIELGRNPDAHTIRWWMKQSDGAREHIFPDDTAYCSLKEALLSLDNFLNVKGGIHLNPRIQDESKYIWGRGPTFDISLLEEAYRDCDISIPWHFRCVRDVRTVEHLCHGQIDIKKMTSEGTKHTALDDAVFQAKYISQMWQLLTERFKE